MTPSELVYRIGFNPLFCPHLERPMIAIVSETR